MGRLYIIHHPRYKGLYTSDINKVGEWTRIEIMYGKTTYRYYTQDTITMNELNQKFIKITTIEEKDKIIGTNFIIEIETVDIEYDENEELSKEHWQDRDYLRSW